MSFDSKRFAALLMRDTTRSLKGTNIQDYMASENDKERFRNMFAHKDNEERHAVTCLNLHLRESSGTNINVEVFGVRYKRLDGVPNYILGIRENGEDRWMAPLAQIEQPHEQRRQKRSSRRSVATSNPPATVIGAPSSSQPALNTQSSSSSSSFDSPCTSTSSEDKKNTRQQLQPTGSGAKLQSMAELISMWSIIASGKSCCAYHVSLDEAKNVVRKMRKGPCQPTFYDEDLLQCGVCGILNEAKDSRQCTMCDSDLLASRLAL
eukprot:TRINITY_DN8846_c0_g3_i3.p1 TRINITY_DN8846_c0_g3~~TRINITY_DN8846_c0_g3_i3.p1  ORF type:complete len:264 (+),score=30.96 TRINITY_DN8846_c0_g3_i3:61-852(+)